MPTADEHRFNLAKMRAAWTLAGDDRPERIAVWIDTVLGHAGIKAPSAEVTELIVNALRDKSTHDIALAMSKTAYTFDFKLHSTWRVRDELQKLSEEKKSAKAPAIDDAAYHRSYLPYEEDVAVRARRLGSRNQRGPAVHAPTEYDNETVCAVSAYLLQPDRLSHISLRRRRGQDFQKFATPWERQWTSLTPIVEEAPGGGWYTVIGYKGVFNSESIFVMRGGGAVDTDNDGDLDKWLSLNEQIEAGYPVRIGERKPKWDPKPRSIQNVIVNPDPHGSVAYSGAPSGDEYKYSVIVDTNGYVLLELGRSKRPMPSGYAVAPDIDPSILFDVSRLLAVAIGAAVGATLIRKLGTKLAVGPRGGSIGIRSTGGSGGGGNLPTARVVKGGTGAEARQTSRGIGAVGPAPRRIDDVNDAASAQRVERALAEEGGELTADEMGNYVARALQIRPELVRLMKARALEGAELVREVRTILADWEKRTTKKVVVKPKGEVQRVAGGKNYASHRDNELWIEQQIFDNPKDLYDEVVHELAADAVHRKRKNLPQLIGRSARWTNGLGCVEHSVKLGGWAQYRQVFLNVPDP